MSADPASLNARVLTTDEADCPGHRAGNIEAPPPDRIAAMPMTLTL